LAPRRPERYAGSARRPRAPGLRARDRPRTPAPPAALSAGREDPRRAARRRGGTRPCLDDRVREGREALHRCGRIRAPPRARRREDRARPLAARGAEGRPVRPAPRHGRDGVRAAHPEGAELVSAATKQRLDIQGLRAVAVVAVIAAHVTHVPQGGFVGVDIFFVISGFLITGLLLRETARTGTISFTTFYERRANRILPAAVIVLVATVIASFALLGKSGGKGVAIDAIFSAFFTGNWRFAFEGVDYFAQGTPPSPLQHFWSLGVEEQFYLVWPWVMLGIALLAARFGWRDKRTRRLTR